MNRFISDLHFGHKNCMDYDNRPFVSIEEHDATIINNWNDVTDINDDVYILGDISWYGAQKTIDIIKQLNGNKHWIIGNHDKKLLRCPELRALFVEITDYKELQIDDKHICVLCHYPIPCFNAHYYGSYHLYGHVHSSFEENMIQHFKREMTELYDKPCNMWNVGVMMPHINYTPRTLGEIIGFHNEYIMPENASHRKQRGRTAPNSKEDAHKCMNCKFCLIKETEPYTYEYWCTWGQERKLPATETNPTDFCDAGEWEEEND